MIASGRPNFIRIGCWTFFKLSFKTSFDNMFNMFKIVLGSIRYRAFATFQIELYRVVDYDSKWSTKFHKDCMLEFF